jgi:hypothetical protein
VRRELRIEDVDSAAGSPDDTALPEGAMEKSKKSSGKSKPSGRRATKDLPTRKADVTGGAPRDAATGLASGKRQHKAITIP